MLGFVAALAAELFNRFGSRLKPEEDVYPVSKQTVVHGKGEC